MKPVTRHLVTTVNNVELLPNGKPAKRMIKKEKINTIDQIKPGVYAVIKLNTPAKNFSIIKFSISNHVDLVAKLLDEVKMSKYQIADVSTSTFDPFGVTIEWEQDQYTSGVFTVYCTSQDEVDTLTELLREVKLGVRQVESVHKLTMS